LNAVESEPTEGISAAEAQIFFIAFSFIFFGVFFLFSIPKCHLPPLYEKTSWKRGPKVCNNKMIEKN
jgi:hypothetical protein